MTQKEIYDFMLRSKKQFLSKHIAKRFNLAIQSTNRCLKNLVVSGFIVRKKLNGNKFIYVVKG